MNTLKSTQIHHGHIEKAVTQQHVLLPMRSWLAMLPATQLAAALLYRGAAPAWMYTVSAALFVAPLTAQWLLRAVHHRLPAALNDEIWRGLATSMLVTGCLAQGVSGALFATLPGEQQRMLIVAALCFIAAIVPSRWNGLQLGLATLFLLGPTAGILAFDSIPPMPMSLLVILGGALALFKFAAYDARRQKRRRVGRPMHASTAPEVYAQHDEWGADTEFPAAQFTDPRPASEPGAQTKSTFLARLSHDLRTPMNGIIGTTELLERESLTEHQRQLVQTVQLSATSLLEIIDNVLDCTLVETAASAMQTDSAYPPQATTHQPPLGELELNARMPADGDDRGTPDTVLVVDDSELNLRVLCEQLRTLGVLADTATDGLQGLAKWRSRHYALVIADIQMPCMNGIEMTRHIRAEEARAGARRRTPIIALTATARRGVDQLAIAAGFDGYLTKPLMLRRLQETLAHWTAAWAASSASPSTPPNVSPVDRQALMEMVGGNSDVADDVLRRFATVGAGLVAEIGGAVHDGDQLKRLAHKLKGTARSVCAPRLADLAEKLEASRNAGGIAALEQEWSRVAATLQRLNDATNKSAA